LASAAVLSLALAWADRTAGQEPKGVPWDWTHHRVVFSQPGTAEEAIQKGTYEHWLNLSTAPRYLVQQQKRRANAEGHTRADLAQELSAYEPPAPEAVR